MPAKKNDDAASLSGGELSQELIDQMLNGGDLGPTVDTWSDEQLRAEIEAAHAAASVSSLEEDPAAAGSPGLRLVEPTTAAAAGPTAVPAAPVAAPAPTAVHPVQFMPLTPDPPSLDSSHGIELLLDVALEVSVELGRSHMSIGEILALRTGSVIELDKLAGEPVDVSVNGTLVARGEVVVVDEKFGVRITEVVSKARRIASLA